MKYKEVSDYIVDSIKSEKYNPNDKIPSETELMKKFNTSRMTVRKAIEATINMGYVYSVKGKGSFVIDDNKKFEIDLNDISGFTKRTLNLGMKPTTSIVNLSTKEPSEIIKKKFDKDLESVLYLERVRFINDIPLAVEFAYIDSNYTKHMNLEDITVSLSSFIESSNFKIIKIRKEMKAVIPNNHILELLKVSSNTPVIRIDYTRYLEDGSVLEYAKVFYNQNLFKFVQEINF